MVMGKIEIEGCQIAYTEAGSDSNPPVLLLKKFLMQGG